ncbi:hypothetical protein FRACA_330039 [Frankia canadensis]|uniref:Uncharacterized protein n=1 Tax=Frankia canadensis TaxID=1836972 RepID=A0A2I2KUU6_9ACTN|nr:hypothetical protein [Frankia canadensis]SNQ49436.1 hypothetical protein FRACA_330039 [Frankia canadensis]SOU56726.1 hypothetical protein FRACA_330039 [Frankia canadensis]
MAAVEVTDADLHTALAMTWLDRGSEDPRLTGFQSALRQHLAA